ncbi:hypothetical protein E4U53_001504 [Claviceps sorghi]|nr:hypothetical protein E4U53_001504 [Claviceps sorghi]
MALVPLESQDLAQSGLGIKEEAFQAAVAGLKIEDHLSALLKGKNVTQLFQELRAINEDQTGNSMIQKGVAFLKSNKIPVQGIKDILGFVTPILSFEPTTHTVLNATQGVLGVLIAVCDGHQDFAKLIGKMLDDIYYIDYCLAEELGPKTGEKKDEMFNAFVSVYTKLVEFYIGALKTVSKQGLARLKEELFQSEGLKSKIEEFVQECQHLKQLFEHEARMILRHMDTKLNDGDISQWLGVEKLRGQGEKHGQMVKLCAKESCDFLVSNHTFQTWYHAPGSQAPESRQLVLLGTMGSGKTVTMAYAIEKMMKQNESRMSRPTLCYHYCHESQSGGPAYVFCVLIMSLLQQRPDIKQEFHNWYQKLRESGVVAPETDIDKLGIFLEETLKNYDRPIFIVIDALDECQWKSRKILLRALKSLLQKSLRLKIMFSTRPQVEILDLLVGAHQINLNTYITRFRDAVIVNKSVDDGLHGLSEDVETYVKETLSRLAKGSAIWIKITVECIRGQRIKALGAMKKFLDDMPRPKDLSELYHKLLRQYSENNETALEFAESALVIIASARRPLTVLELAWAMAMNKAPTSTNTVAELSKVVDPQQVLDLIHPFICRVDLSGVKNQEVKLIHHSVKEFALDELVTKPNRPPASSVAEAGAQTGCRRGENPKAMLFDICVRYLSLEELGNRDLASEIVAEEELKSGRKRHCIYMNDVADHLRQRGTEERGYGGLLSYAANHWTDHFGALTPSQLPEPKDIEHICHYGSRRLNNWILVNRQLRGIALESWRKYDAKYDPLIITSRAASWTHDGLTRDISIAEVHQQSGPEKSSRTSQGYSEAKERDAINVAPQVQSPEADKADEKLHMSRSYVALQC